MKSTIRQWNPDAGSYGDVLLTLFAPDTGDSEQDDYALWDITKSVMDFMGQPVAAFYDDEPIASSHVSNYVWRVA